MLTRTRPISELLGHRKVARLDEYDTAWLTYTAHQTKNLQDDDDDPIEDSFQVIGAFENFLFTTFNGVKEAWEPKDGMDLSQLLERVQQWSLFSPVQAHNWLENAADKVSTFNEATTSASMATLPKGGQVDPFKQYSTGPDQGDKHVHECLVDLNGNGMTLKGGDPSHQHVIDRFQVLDWSQDGSKNPSSHPGGVQPNKKGESA